MLPIILWLVSFLAVAFGSPLVGTFSCSSSPVTVIGPSTTEVHTVCPFPATTRPPPSAEFTTVIDRAAPVVNIKGRACSSSSTITVVGSSTTQVMTICPFQTIAPPPPVVAARDELVNADKPTCSSTSVVTVVGPSGTQTMTICPFPTVAPPPAVLDENMLAKINRRACSSSSVITVRGSSTTQTMTICPFPTIAPPSVADWEDGHTTSQPPTPTGTSWCTSTSVITVIGSTGTDTMTICPFPTILPPTLTTTQPPTITGTTSSWCKSTSVVTVSGPTGTYTMTICPFPTIAPPPTTKGAVELSMTCTSSREFSLSSAVIPVVGPSTTESITVFPFPTALPPPPPALDSTQVKHPQNFSLSCDKVTLEPGMFLEATCRDLTQDSVVSRLNLTKCITAGTGKLDWNDAHRDDGFRNCYHPDTNCTLDDASLSCHCDSHWLGDWAPLSTLDLDTGIGSVDGVLTCEVAAGERVPKVSRQLARRQDSRQSSTIITITDGVTATFTLPAFPPASPTSSSSQALTTIVINKGVTTTMVLPAWPSSTQTASSAVAFHNSSFQSTCPYYRLLPGDILVAACRNSADHRNISNYTISAMGLRSCVATSNASLSWGAPDMGSGLSKCNNCTLVDNSTVMRCNCSDLGNSQATIDLDTGVSNINGVLNCDSFTGSAQGGFDFQGACTEITWHNTNRTLTAACPPTGVQDFHTAGAGLSSLNLEDCIGAAYDGSLMWLYGNSPSNITQVCNFFPAVLEASTIGKPYTISAECVVGGQNGTMTWSYIALSDWIGNCNGSLCCANNHA